ncbi:MAG: DNA mismatch repair endonuclease MutL, partial [Arenicellales bacterium]
MSRNPIRQLDDRLINQIAAGEVIERPASLLKELLENSVDAGATRISIQAERGGIKRIRITDNGHGIPRDELELALSRHATSKLQRFDDLFNVSTLGFRGEALPSISAVSRLSIASRALDGDSGYLAECHGGSQVSEPQPLAHATGTTVEVSDLFFNTPARRKFLKTEKTELKHLQDVVRRMALSCFDVAIDFSHNSRQVLAVSAANTPAEREKRIAGICGNSFANQSVYIEDNAGPMILEGWIGLPAFSRTQRDMQFFFVNGRAVKDNLIAHAVRRAYSDVLFHGRHPAFVLFFKIEPRLVDVNVHPAKTEVRFRETRAVHDYIYRCLHRAIATMTPEQSRVELPGPKEGVNTGVEEQYSSSERSRRGFGSLQSQQNIRMLVEEQLHAYSRFQNHEAPPHSSYEGSQELEQSEIPPMGFAIAQLKGVYILAENR